MKSPKTADRSLSRSLLLKAASELMIERASIDVSLQEIAERSGLNSALVKYYFGSKSGLMLALLEDVLGRGLVQMAELVEMDMAPTEKLKLHIKGIITIYYRYPFINRLIHAMFADPRMGKEVVETINKPLAETQRKLLEQGVKAGLFRPIDPMMFYFIVLGACDHLFFGQHILRHAFGVEQVDDNLRRSYTNSILDLILGGLLVRNGPTTDTDNEDRSGAKMALPAF